MCSGSEPWRAPYSWITTGVLPSVGVVLLSSTDGSLALDLGTQANTGTFSFIVPGTLTPGHGGIQTLGHVYRSISLPYKQMIHYGSCKPRACGAPMFTVCNTLTRTSAP
jgi:hypothetical protein